MLRYPLLLGLVLIAATIALTGADGPAEPVAPSAVSSAAESAEAAQVLDRAIATYSVPAVSWMEMTLWQRIWEDRVGQEVHGRCLAAPGNRLRLELKVQVNTTAAFKMISDGKSLWQWQRLGDGPATMSQGYFPALGEQYRTPEAVAEACRALLAEYAFLGPAPLLRSLRTRTQRLGRKLVRWNGVEVIQVTGDWPEDPAKLADIPDPLRPPQLPRLWSVYLDSATLWPHRLEWWGRSAAPGKLSLLLEMEFRDAVVNRPLSPERCAQEFMIPPPESR